MGSKVALINDIMSLPSPMQKTMREIVDIFMRNFGHRNAGELPTEGGDRDPR